MHRKFVNSMLLNCIHFQQAKFSAKLRRNKPCMFERLEFSYYRLSLYNKHLNIGSVHHSSCFPTHKAGGYKLDKGVGLWQSFRSEPLLKWCDSKPPETIRQCFFIANLIKHTRTTSSRLYIRADSTTEGHECVSAK